MVHITAVYGPSYVELQFYFALSVLYILSAITYLRNIYRIKEKERGYLLLYAFCTGTPAFGIYLIDPLSLGFQMTVSEAGKLD